MVATLRRQDSHSILGLRQDLSSRHGEKFQPHHGGSTDEIKFIVPYERNPHFKGRGELLTKLHKKLCEIVPDQHNHRVALYGLGGVGKTQLALEYVYRHWQSKTYDRVYWISAVSQATLFTGLSTGDWHSCALCPRENGSQTIRYCEKCIT